MGEGKRSWKKYTHHIFDDLILAVLSLDFEKVVAEVKEVKATLLSQQHNDGAAGPVQPISKALPTKQGMYNTWAMSPLKRGIQCTFQSISPEDVIRFHNLLCNSKSSPLIKVYLLLMVTEKEVRSKNVPSLDLNVPQLSSFFLFNFL